MDNLEALKLRVQEATGPNRGLDAAIWYALVERPAPGDKIDRDMVGRWPNYTSSVDATLALVERALPGWEWHCLFNPLHGDSGFSYAGLTPPDGSTGASVALPGKRPAIALLAALLTALSSPDRQRGEP